MWRQLVIESLVSPRAAARRVLADRFDPATLLQAAVAVTCTGLVLGFVAMQLTGGAVDPVSAAVLGSPLMGALAQLGVMALAAFLTFRVGRLFGGSGDFWGAAQVVVWLNAITLAIQAVQLVALALAPPIAGLIAVGTLFWLLWAYATFVTELHGFRSAAMVLGATVLVVVGLVFVATIMAGILGIAPQGV
jgi:hypothetical protein